ncbi:single-pass membrane and coiled-coil domain-containing protein 3-like [Puntigrus tetrazona]|uniref:single-pass membrane and coiled-coil domain-containing protein 3-like n=1 Tax=Puntigrus tetrazona TaxID=1606681 RepID=UPI001C8AA8AA|nr:single-pass membrane and coiled-coil domain-containing protein 3-like [Puntigrus tetrazona]
MSLSDWLYPGNPKRREKVIRRSQELLELMKNNFRATNSLSEIVNKHLGSSFDPIALDERATVKENCEVMIERVNQIQAKVEEVNEELKNKLDPAMYEQLQKMSFHDLKTLSVAQKRVISSTCQVSAAIIVTVLMKKIRVLTNITSTCVRVVGGMIATFVVGLLIDLIASAIIGHYERKHLEEALEDHEKVLVEFRPASEQYQDAIAEVKAVIAFL